MTVASIGGIETGIDALLSRPWDFIIVGGGSAGCVLARRLSEDADSRVLLIEAGTEAHDPAISAPPAWPGLAGGRHDWNYASVPQSGLLDRTLAQPRGKGMGGSTLINALGFQRGPMRAYDQWATLTGDCGWSGAALLPYFRRLETASTGADKWRGGTGPLQVLEIGDVPDQNPLSVAMAQAGVAAGHGANPDWNGARAGGTIWTQLTIRDGRRDTAASAYVDPIRQRANLGIATGVEVIRVTVAGNRCTGVELLADGRLHPVRACRETILCAGAFDTPRLLMLSGIGDADRLRAIGIDPVCDLPDVGQHLQDHPLIPGLLYQAKKPVPLSHYNHCETMVIASSGQAPPWPDLQLMFLTVPFLSPELGSPPPDTFSIVPALMAPRSRGSVKLVAADRRVPMHIDPAYLADPQDVEALVDAVEISRDIASQAPLREWIAEEVFPGPAMRDRPAIARHIRRTVSPFFHPVSTCRMGPGAGSVTDTRCRVHGIAALRIVDASILPSIPQAMTNAAVLAVAERAADLIRCA
jgi:choline dehydrogenase-like flavoprotein